MTPTLRLDDCADFLTLRQYCAWRGVAASTVYRQIKLGTCYVMPAQQEPLLWRRDECERRMLGTNLIEQRKSRAKEALRIARAS